MTHKHIPATAGVYLLTNTATGDSYVGSSVNLRSRAAHHFSAMRRTSRLNSPLLRHFAAHQADEFRFSILELCDAEVRRVRETDWIDRLSPTLNVNDGCARRVPVSIRMSGALWRRFCKICEANGETPANAIRRLLHDYVEKNIRPRRRQPAGAR